MNLVNLQKKLDLRVKAGINKALEVLKEDIDTKTPTKSGDLLEGNEIESAEKTGTRFAGKVVNDVDHGKYVEFGVKSSSYNYHKGPPTNDSTIYYSGVGARMFTRGFEEKRNEIKSIIQKAIKGT